MGVSRRDHLGRLIKLSAPPQRIVSLSPSVTETLLALNVGERLIGRTRYCIHPAPAVEAIPIIGGTRPLDVPRITASRPELIIADKDENPRLQVEALMERWPVFVVHICDRAEALRVVEDLGALTGQVDEAAALTGRIEDEFAQINALNPPVRVAYLIWRRPYMAAGGGTFIDAMLRRCGLENVLADVGERYPRISVSQLRDRKPELLLLSSEPFAFSPAQGDELAELIPGAKVLFVDGEAFAWYGSAMVRSAQYLASLTANIRSTL